MLERGFDLPQLMLTTDEVEAVTLGAQWVIAHADADLARAALGVLEGDGDRAGRDAQADRRPGGGDRAAARRAAGIGARIRRVRETSRRGRKIAIDYQDAAGAPTRRVVWPFLVGYVATVRVVIAWCELRAHFRIFRTDRFAGIDFLDTSYPEHAVVLHRRWLASRVRESDRASESIRQMFLMSPGSGPD